MPVLNDQPAILRSERIYQWLLAIYPAAFRREYGPSMTQLFRDQCREAYGREQVWGLCKTWLSVGRDLGKSAFAEHISTMKVKLDMTNTPLFTSPRRRWMAGAFLLVCTATCLLTWWLPRFYASTARITVHQESQDKPDAPSLFAKAANGGNFDPYFLQTEFERLKSKEVLDRVITDLMLKEAWSRKYGVQFQNRDLYAILRKRMDVRNYRSTSLVEIRVLDEDPKMAAAIANSIAESYRQMRLDHLRVAAIQGIEGLERALKAQESKVQAAEGQLAKIQDGGNLADALAEGPQPNQGGPERLRQLEGQAKEAELAHRQMESLYERMSNLKETELISVLPTAYPDTLLTELLSRRNQAEVELLALRKDFGSEHPNVARTRAVFDKLSEQVQERVQGILAGVKFKVQNLGTEQQMREESWQAAVKHETEQARKYGAYTLAKRDLEFERQMRQTLALRLAQEQADANLQKPVLVELVDRAEPGLRPVLPNVPVNIAMGILLGLLASLLMALALFIKGLLTRNAPNHPA